jgi:octaprenyl-diphosphate synthase
MPAPLADYSRNHSMKHVSAAIREDFEALNRLVISSLHSDVGLVESIGHYIVEGGGKRMRPLISLLSARALGHTGPGAVDFATVIEFLHTATLLHDDVVDVSQLRRGRATANANWGNAPSVLVGDFIYSRAFQLLVGLEDMRLLRLVADTTNLIAEGEVEQLARAGDPATTEAQYLQVIRKKTAVLFAAAAEGGALLAGADAGTCARLRDYGLHLGLAFQLVDDALDYTGDAARMGKNAGDDLAEGKPTLPLIHAMQHASPADAARVHNAIATRDGSDLAGILDIVRGSGSLDYTLKAAERQRDLALAALAPVPATPFRDNLEQLAVLSVERDH